MKEIQYLIYLHSIGFSQKKLLSIFWSRKNYREIFEAISYKNLQRLGFFEKQISKILENKKNLKKEEIDKKILWEKVKFIVFWDEGYPKLLKEISNPPYLLYVKWDIDNTACFSVIGSRKISMYGKKVISDIVGDISHFFTIVSWGAYGCDTFAHQTTLNAKGKTIVIPWTGIDIDYPAVNKKMYKKIIETGWAIVSIFPFWEPWNPYNFPMRNEIISWFSLWTLVIEAWEKSWTLITANMTLDQWRDLFAIPWEIGKYNSLWCNQLLKKWEAKMVISSEDILEEYNFLLKQKKNKTRDIQDPFHKKICDFLSYEPLFSDEIALKMNMEIYEIIPHISILEIQKIIEKNKEGKYELC